MAIFAPDAAAAPFDLCGGHPVLDFVNSLDDRFDADGAHERLPNYGELLRFAQEAGLLSPQQARELANSVSSAAATRALRQARELREALAAVLYARADERAPSASDLAKLEDRFEDAESPRLLQWNTGGQEKGGVLRCSWRDDQLKAAAFPVWVLADAAAQLVLSDALGRVRACEADTCRWLFLDTSKNHSRRWCNMKVCGNRAKARRFQARRAE
jgi:predicted RNA-binding Zn ribbon-like protein